MKHFWDILEHLSIFSIQDIAIAKFSVKLCLFAGKICETVLAEISY